MPRAKVQHVWIRTYVCNASCAIPLWWCRCTVFFFFALRKPHIGAARLTNSPTDSFNLLSRLDPSAAGIERVCRTQECGLSYIALRLFIPCGSLSRPITRCGTTADECNIFILIARESCRYYRHSRRERKREFPGSAIRKTLRQNEVDIELNSPHARRMKSNYSLTSQDAREHMKGNQGLFRLCARSHTSL